MTDKQKNEAIDALSAKLESIRRERIDEERALEATKSIHNSEKDNLKKTLLDIDNAKKTAENILSEAMKTKQDCVQEIADTKKQGIDQIAMVNQDLAEKTRQKSLVEIDIEGLETKKSKLGGDTASLQASYDDLQERYTELIATYSDVEGKVEEGNAQIVKNDEKIAEQQALIATQQGRIDENNNKLTDQENILSIKIKNITTIADKEDYVNSKENYLISYLKRFNLDYEPFSKNN